MNRLSSLPQGPYGPIHFDLGLSGARTSRLATRIKDG